MRTRVTRWAPGVEAGGGHEVELGVRVAGAACGSERSTNSPIHLPGSKQTPNNTNSQHRQVVASEAVLREFDITTMTKEDAAFEAPFALCARRADYVHALVAHFDVSFTACHKPVRFSTAPAARPTHWKQTVLYLEDALAVCEGEEITGTLACRPNDKNPRDLVRACPLPPPPFGGCWLAFCWWGLFWRRRRDDGRLRYSCLTTPKPRPCSSTPGVATHRYSTPPTTTTTTTSNNQQDITLRYDFAGRHGEAHRTQHYRMR